MLDKRDLIFIILIFIIIIFSFYFIGIFSVGHQLNDDGVLFGLYDILQEKSFSQTILEYFKTGEIIRFRPLYYPYLIFKVHLFGLNIFYNLLFTTILGCISITFFYIGMRKLNCSIYESFLFICLMFLGNQIVIIQRNDPNETIGVFFLSIAFFFITIRSKYLSLIFSSFFLILSSLCKESFTVMIPSMIFLKLYIDKEYLNITLKETLKRNILFIIPIFVFFINILFIFNAYRKSSGMYYNESNFFNFLKQAITLPLRSTQFLYCLFITFAVYLTILIKEEINILKYIKNNKYIFIFLLLAIFPNIVIHAKANLSERYLLPVLFTTAFACMIIIKNIKKYVWLYKFLIISVSLSILPLIYITCNGTIKHINESNKVKSFFNVIEKQVNDNSNILVVIRPDISWQTSVLTDNYIQHYLNMTPSFLFIESEDDKISEYGLILKDSLSLMYKNQMYSPDKLYDIIVFFDTKYSDFISYTDISDKKYYLYDSNIIYPIYVKN